MNIGCGDRPAPAPWVNCDIFPDLAPDVEMDAVRPWPFSVESQSRVFMGQVIEHLDYPWGVRKALREAARVLAPGGRLVVITPDFQAIKEKGCGAEVWRNEARGMCRWPGDEHRWMPTRGLVLAEVRRWLPRAEVVNWMNLPADWPEGSRNPWDCCVLAVKA